MYNSKPANPLLFVDPLNHPGFAIFYNNHLFLFLLYMFKYSMLVVMSIIYLFSS